LSHGGRDEYLSESEISQQVLCAHQQKAAPTLALVLACGGPAGRRGRSLCGVMDLRFESAAGKSDVTAVALVAAAAARA